MSILSDELTNDPLGRGYAGMTNAQVVTDINTVYRTRNRTIMTASEVINAVDSGEFTALNNANTAMFWNIIHIGDLNPFGVEATLLISVFGGGSTTISNLAALRTIAITRAQELNIPGRVRVGEVIAARNV